MTREEAIKLIEHISIAFVPTDQYGDYDDPQPYEEALDMAIEALLQVTGKLRNPDDSLLTADSEACKEQKSKLDLISRQDAIKVLNDRQYDIRAFIEKENMEYKESHSYWCEIHGIYNSIELIESLPSATSQSLTKPNKSCEDDLISRQGAINAIENTDAELTEKDWDELTDAINALPSADRPTEWIPVSEALPIKGQVVLDIDDKETWGNKGTWDVDKQRGW